MLDYFSKLVLWDCSLLSSPGLLARNAVNVGLRVPKHIHACVNVGNGLTYTYLKEAGVLECLSSAGYVLLACTLKFGGISLPSLCTTSALNKRVGVCPKLHGICGVNAHGGVQCIHVCCTRFRRLNS